MSDIAKYVLPLVPVPIAADQLVRGIHAQFDHISETYFAGFDFDLGERELGTRCHSIMTSICSLRCLGWSRRRSRL